jgi:hypothetical protein
MKVKKLGTINGRVYSFVPTLGFFFYNRIRKEEIYVKNYILKYVTFLEINYLKRFQLFR